MQIDRRHFLGAVAAALLVPGSAGAQVFRGRRGYYYPQRVQKVEAQKPLELKISEVITGDRIPDKYQAYFKVETGKEGWFYVALLKETDNQKISKAAYDLDQKARGEVFPKPTDYSKPVAIIDATGGGISGTFEIVDTGSSYRSDYPVNALFELPGHTEVSTNFLLDINDSLNALPEGVVKALKDNGLRVMIAKNVEDSYYWLYPSWKIEDQSTPVDSSKPWIEKINGEWIDNRKHINVPGYYLSGKNKIVIPQQYIKYGTKNEVMDRLGQSEWTKSTVFHEAGHGIDYLPNSYRYSDLSNFVTEYDKDRKEIPEEEEEKVGYFLKNRREPFADLVAALMGGLSKSRTERILSFFPRAAEVIRKEVLPKYGYKVSADYIRENIYPDYGLEKTARVRANLERSLAGIIEEDKILCC